MQETSKTGDMWDKKGMDIFWAIYSAAKMDSRLSIGILNKTGTTTIYSKHFNRKSDSVIH